MTARRVLPNRRRNAVLVSEHDCQNVRVQVTYDATGAPLEVFIDAGKVGSAIHTAGHDIGVTLSLAMQYGVPLGAIRRALMQNPDGTGAGLAGHVLDRLDALGYARG